MQFRENVIFLKNQIELNKFFVLLKMRGATDPANKDLEGLQHRNIISWKGTYQEAPEELPSYYNFSL